MDIFNCHLLDISVSSLEWESNYSQSIVHHDAILLRGVRTKSVVAVPFPHCLSIHLHFVSFRSLPSRFVFQTDDAFSLSLSLRRPSIAPTDFHRSADQNRRFAKIHDKPRPPLPTAPPKTLRLLIGLRESALRLFLSSTLVSFISNAPMLVCRLRPSYLCLICHTSI